MKACFFWSMLWSIIVLQEFQKIVVWIYFSCCHNVANSRIRHIFSILIGARQVWFIICKNRNYGPAAWIQEIFHLLEGIINLFKVSPYQNTLRQNSAATKSFNTWMTSSTVYQNMSSFITKWKFIRFLEFLLHYISAHNLDILIGLSRWPLLSYYH